jgi:4-hydroxy-tetrahydrodipicolinate reductase
VVVWATGDVGKRAIREIIRHPNLDLVGVLTYNPEKVGRDAGDFTGEAPNGVLFTMDKQAIYDLKADCCVYTARASSAGTSRIGSSIEDVVDDVVGLLSAGTNITTTVTDFHAFGHPRLGTGLERIRQACESTGASLYAAGTDPGYVLEQIAYAFLAAQRTIDSVEIIEFGDLSRRPSPHMIFDQMGFGKPMAEFSADAWSAHLIEDYAGPLIQLAKAAGFKPDGTSVRGEVAAATEDVQIIAGLIKKGSVGGQRFIMSVLSEGREVVMLDQYAYVTLKVDAPTWDMRKPGWRVKVNGDAPFDADLTFPVAYAELGQYIPAYNANLPVNAIPYVIKAKPGIVTTEQLPPILPSGPIEDR